MLDDNFTESEYLQMQDYYADEFCDSAELTSISSTITVSITVPSKGKCLVSFSSVPAIKVRKRLRDFKFKYNGCEWVGAKDKCATVSEYLRRNTTYKVTVRQ